jgi:AcrR family transcriptional regulator
MLFIKNTIDHSGQSWYYAIDRCGQHYIGKGLMMNEILKNMDSEKRDRIINASLEEFGKNSFEKASTNNIVKKAGISKGLLFHYFENKRGLRDYLEGYVIRTVISTLQNELDWEETDFFNRLKQVAIIKGRLTYRFPFIFEFFTNIVDSMDYDTLLKYREDFAPGLMEKIYTHNIDYARFKPGLDMEKVMKIINWVIEKYGLELLDQLKKTKEPWDYPKINKEFEEYMDILRKAFYR